MTEEKKKYFIWKPREFKTQPVVGVKFEEPIGLEDNMYFYTGDDEDGNPILEQVGIIDFKNGKSDHEVTYFASYEGPRDHESEASKQARVQYLEDKKIAEETAAAVAAEATRIAREAEDAAKAAEAEAAKTDEAPSETEPVEESGSTGDSTGPHVHVDVDGAKAE